MNKGCGPSGERYGEDITALAGIPNRGPATPGEGKAADYVFGRMKELGLNPEDETFGVIPHFPLSWAMHSALCAAAGILAIFHPLPGAALALFAAVSYYGDTTTRFYWLRRLLPSGKSRRVIGKLEPEGGGAKTVVVVSHIDAGQMGFSLNPEKAEPTSIFFARHFGIQPPMVSMIFWIMVVALFGALLRAAAGPGVFQTALLLFAAAGNMIPVVIFVPHEFAAICPGANDNASGVAVNIELARRFGADPLKNTRILFACVGSEETYMMGMAVFMDEWRDRLDPKSTWFLIPESCGVGSPRVLIGEGVARIRRFDTALCGALLESAKELGYSDTGTIVLRTGGTDATPPVERGYRAAGIIAMDENNYVRNYHWHGDLPENLDINTVRRISDIFERAIRKIDEAF
jgi:hypothetical protein